MSNLTLNKNSVRAGIATVGIIGGFVSGYGVLVPFYIDKYLLDIEIGGRLFALTGFSGLVGVFITSYLIDKVKASIAVPTPLLTCCSWGSTFCSAQENMRALLTQMLAPSASVMSIL